MREMLFRGKSTDNGKWVEGGLLSIDLDTYSEIEKKKTHCIVEPNAEFYRGQIGPFEFVIPDTIGQYTGLTDKNGTKIFEGDIFKPYEDEIIYIAWIEYFSTLGLMVHTTIEKKKYGKVASKFVQEGFNFLCDYKLDELEVIGNIHDNPELLNVK